MNDNSSGLQHLTLLDDLQQIADMIVVKVVGASGAHSIR